MLFRSTLLRELPPPTPEEILDFLWRNRDKASAVVANLEQNGWFADIEKENLFNRILVDTLGHWRVVGMVLLLGVAGLFVFGMWRLIIAKGKNPKNIPRLAAALDRVRPRTGLLDMRLQGALRAGQFYEAARIKARELFTHLGVQPAQEGLPPKVEIEAGWWRRSRIEHDLREIWQIAYGEQPVPVPAKKWDRWQQRLRSLGQLIEQRVIRFE